MNTMNWEIVIGVSSTVIALCALGTSTWHGIQSRAHNKISCRPHLTTWAHNKSSQGIYAVDLLNNGLGPAIIKSFVIKVDGNVITGDGIKPIEKALKVLFPNEQYNAEYEYLGKNHAMPAKAMCRVVAIKFLSEKPPSSDYVEHTMNKADLEVEYESFYGEKFAFSTVDERPNN